MSVGRSEAVLDTSDVNLCNVQCYDYRSYVGICPLQANMSRATYSMQLPLLQVFGLLAVSALVLVQKIEGEIK